MICLTSYSSETLLCPSRERNPASNKVIKWWLCMTFCCYTHLFYFLYSGTSLPLMLPTSCNRVKPVRPVEVSACWHTNSALSTLNRHRPSPPRSRCPYESIPGPRQSISVHRRKWLNFTVQWNPNPMLLESLKHWCQRQKQIYFDWKQFKEICLIDSPIPLGRLRRAKGNFQRGDTDILLVDSISPPCRILFRRGWTIVAGGDCSCFDNT